METKRISLLDEIRGFAVILMVIYHLLYNLAYIYYVPFALKTMYALLPYDTVIGTIFVTVSGVSSQFSRSNIKRGLKILPIPLIITLVTYFFMYDMRIMFGVLHFLSVAMIYYGLTKKFHNKIPSVLGLILSFVLWLATKKLYMREIAFFFKMPDFFYNTNIFFPLGMYNASFYSSDYFPFFPWIFVFLFGTYIGKFIKEHNMPSFIYKPHSKALSYLGKHALVIYVAHQPILYGVLWLIFTIFK